MEQDPRFKNLERKLGVFILIALSGILLSVAIVGYQKDIFTSKFKLHFTVQRGTGFTKGMPVKLSGFRIGKVTEMKLNEQAMVDITINVARKYKRWIGSDSVVRLVKESLLGDRIVELTVGSPELSPCQEGDYLKYEKSKGLDEIADEIAEKVKPVLADLSEIISYVNDPEGDLKKSITNLELLTRNLEKTRENSDLLLLITNERLENIHNKTIALLDNADRKITAIDHEKLNSTLAGLPPLLEKADTTMANLVKLSAETKEMAEKSLPMVPGLLSRTEELIFSTDQLMNSLNNSWILGGRKKPLLQQTEKAGDSHD